MSESQAISVVVVEVQLRAWKPCSLKVITSNYPYKQTGDQRLLEMEV